MAKQKDYLNALLGNGEGGATTSDSTAQSSQPRKTHGDKNAKAVPLDNGQSDKDESKAKPKNETDNMDGMAKGTATSPLAKNNPARNSQPPHSRMRPMPRKVRERRDALACRYWAGAKMHWRGWLPARLNRSPNCRLIRARCVSGLAMPVSMNA